MDNIKLSGTIIPEKIMVGENAVLCETRIVSSSIYLTVTIATYILIVYTKEVFRMQTAKVFQSGNSQAIRIPKEMQTTEKEFAIHKYGNCYFLTPVGDPWALLRQSIGEPTDDFSFDRKQPMISDFPDREEF